MNNNRMNDHEENPWIRVPIVREERDEGLMVPEIGVHPHAIKEYRVSSTLHPRGGRFLIVETKSYLRRVCRVVVQVVDLIEVICMDSTRVRLVHKTRGGKKFAEFIFTDDECSLQFQMDVMTAF